MINSYRVISWGLNKRETNSDVGGNVVLERSADYIREQTIRGDQSSRTCTPSLQKIFYKHKSHRHIYQIRAQRLGNMNVYRLKGLKVNNTLFEASLLRLFLCEM